MGVSFRKPKGHGTTEKRHAKEETELLLIWNPSLVSVQHSAAPPLKRCSGMSQGNRSSRCRNRKPCLTRAFFLNSCWIWKKYLPVNITEVVCSEIKPLKKECLALSKMWLLSIYCSLLTDIVLLSCKYMALQVTGHCKAHTTTIIIASSHFTEWLNIMIFRLEMWIILSLKTEWKPDMGVMQL